MLRIAVCDDAQDILQHTQSLIESWKNSVFRFHIEAFDNGDDLIAAHRTTPFDILILDIVMPLLNGIDTAREIREFDRTVKIIFLTSAPEFAVESYTVKATNYLLKPIESEKLHACLQELCQEFKKERRNIAVRSASAIYKVAFQDIEYVEAQNKAVQFCMTDGRVLHSNQPLYDYEHELTLADGFFRCHRSYIVNLQQVDHYTSKELFMSSGMRIPISRSNQKDFESAYFETLFGKAGER